MSAESAATGSRTSVPSANGTRIASACAPSSGMPSQKAPWAQDVCRPSWQNLHVPSETANGLTTRSPLLTLLTSEPVSSTTPMNSWPIRAGPSAGDLEPYGHRSLPQMQEAVTRTSASVGCLMTESGTSSTRTSPAPYRWVARMEVFSDRSCLSDSRRAAARGDGEGGRGDHGQCGDDRADHGGTGGAERGRLRPQLATVQPKYTSARTISSPSKVRISVLRPRPPAGCVRS